MMFQTSMSGTCLKKLMKITYDITPQQTADELFNKYLLLNPYQSNQHLRNRIAVESTLLGVGLIMKYSAHFIDDGFWEDVKTCLLNKL